jgi:hypothetical protein
MHLTTPFITGAAFFPLLRNPFVNAYKRLQTFKNVYFNMVMCLFFIYLHKTKKDIMFVYAQILPITTIGVVELLCTRLVGNIISEKNKILNNLFYLLVIQDESSGYILSILFFYICIKANYYESSIVNKTF